MNKNKFIITSDNCRIHANILVGYLITDEKLYIDWSEEINSFDTFETKKGAFVVLTRNGNMLHIHRDGSGLIRLYYFQKDNYWAISNSFWDLCDMISSKYLLTLNKGFAEALLVDSMTAFLPYQSLCNEIKVVSVFDVIDINCETTELSIKNNCAISEKVNLDSQKGMQIIDNWISEWSSIIKGLDNSKWNIRIDLSGGYDSRISYALAKAANVDFNSENVHVFSIKPKDEGARKHFNGDYEIAELIAGEDKVNPEVSFSAVKITEEDRYEIYKTNISDCVNQVFDRCYFYRKPMIVWGGYLGETVRGYEEHYTIDKLISNSVVRDDKYGLYMAMKNSIMSTIDSMNGTHQNLSSDESNEIAKLLCIECLDGAFFGKQIQQYQRMNIICMGALGDINLRRLSINHNYDSRIVFAVILSRICPELLEIPFSSETSFTMDEIEYARELCSRFPSKVSIDINRTIDGVNAFYVDEYREANDLNDNIVNFIFDDFYRSETQKLFIKKFPENGEFIYQFAANKLKDCTFHNESYAAAICAISRMISIEDNSKRILGITQLPVEDTVTWQDLEKEFDNYETLGVVYHMELDSIRMREYIAEAKMSSGKDIYLYGAGYYATELFNRLKDEGIKIKAFVVTEKSLEKDCIEDIPIFSKDEINLSSKKDIVFAAVTHKYYEEVSKEISAIMQ